ncbi:hypothetical protein P691DRAFT_733620 [Macrolepiota fuliginosa MF-IS2]|uniref:AB hydrolase-1 domain-containing protein n=1 Tax=Macrolepiota fuliginosa MF-IS2 TaxID=1400762 RepID=A0A9P5XBH4_9AGAR|nr:hypothetical protein P691DRAFT_733620 [Macrolepiota fuliginosa MF-IS2]
MTTSYPRIPPKPIKPFPCRPLLPVFPPADPLTYPSLPSPRRKPAFDSLFTLSTHLVPAAHLRRGPRLPLPHLPPPHTPSSERAAAFSELSKRLHGNGMIPAVVNGQHENVLWNVLNRYARGGLNSTNSTGITLFFAHANGYPRETWEPVLGRIFSSPITNMIDEVWTWECVQHGDAGLINAEALTGYFDWSDNARDMLNFFLYFLPSTTLDGTLPVHLLRIPTAETQERVSSGFKHRTLIPIGHSYSGTALALGAVDYPKLFSSLIFVDPVMMDPGLPEEVRQIVGKWGFKAVSNALSRKDTWNSKEEAYAEFSSSPFYKAWDPETLELYIYHGLYDTTITTPIGMHKRVAKLKLTSLHEALVFAGGDVLMEAFARLPELDERVRLHWIMPGAKGATEFGPPGSQRDRVWVRPKNSSNVRITRAGHLIPQECPAEFAQEIIQFLERHYAKEKTLRSNL